jgi:hypothetical protein
VVDPNKPAFFLANCKRYFRIETSTEPVVRPAYIGSVLGQRLSAAIAFYRRQTLFLPQHAGSGKESNLDYAAGCMKALNLLAST